jgi:hypothetical protein
LRTGGKEAGRKNYVLKDLVNPLKETRTPCTGLHTFAEETLKGNAERGTGNILDGIICGGTKEGVVCGNEFVSNKCEANCPEKAYVVGMRNPAMWCSKCHLVLCKPCHGDYVSADHGISRVKLAFDE